MRRVIVRTSSGKYVGNLHLLTRTLHCKNANRTTAVACASVLSYIYRLWCHDIASDRNRAAVGPIATVCTTSLPTFT